jgi:hypothetical protein
MARKYWSARVMQRSDALDLEKGAFTQRSARKVAESLKRSADRSKRRKAGAFQSAMSMLNFFINRAGRNLPESRRRTLERAKNELRVLYGRQPRRTRKKTSRR